MSPPAAGKEPPPDMKPGEKKPGPWERNSRYLLWYVPLALVLLWLWQDMAYNARVKTIPYSEFKDHLAKGEINEIEVREGEIVGRIVPRDEDKEAAGAGTDKAASAETKPSGEGNAKEGEEGFLFRTVRPPQIEDRNLIEQLETAGVRFRGVHPGFLQQFLVMWALPLGIIILLWFLMSRSMGAARQVLTGFGRSRARLSEDRETGVRFEDVAGVDEAKHELQEVVDFLKNPDRYVKIGARIPKGVLLAGPPGTGKTLLARAVAGEAGVPFFSISGSDFVEMFVGVGAARVRDLFEQGKRSAPCIIFIDELDAVGRQRTIHMGATNDEREQTLNQLLVEMDGFEPNSGVILLAATNRPEVLDRALLRPGRFDRQIVVDAPDMVGREAILRVHARNKPLADDVDFRRIAQATPGFSGADLANALNEAALLAARRKADHITQHDLEDAVEKVVAGPERKSRRLEADERRRVAFHEVGHALVAAFSEHADPVHKISIVPRGRAALGYTMQLPTEQQFLITESEIMDRLKGLLGGRASEEVVFGEVSSGAENDLHRATAMARQMICIYGMSDVVGLMHCGQRSDPFLPVLDGGTQRDCSEATAQQIDEEVKRLLNAAYSDAKAILVKHRGQLDHIAEELLSRETLDGPTFQKLLARDPTDASPLQPAQSSSNGR